MTEAIHPTLYAIAEVVDLVGLVILLVGAIKFILVYLRIEALRLAGRQCIAEIHRARQVLGSYILVALEFLIVSDVIASVVTRDLESLGALATIVIVRTVIGYFLERELRGEAPDIASS